MAGAMVVDRNGYRLNVGIILVSEQKHVFWGRRVGHDTWQFPQGGVDEHESAENAMYRELYEEVGLSPTDVEIIGVTSKWYRYRLPQQYLRSGNGRDPRVIGQKQKWFLIRLTSPEQKIHLDLTESPEFDSWRWVDYWLPPKDVIYFKRKVYRLALKELESFLFPEKDEREEC